MPSVCAGLRQTLLQGYGRNFPLDPSPFQRVADATGATPRELLAQCRRLQAQSQLDGLGVSWGESVVRQRWRIALPEAPEQRLLGAALRQPGIVALERWTAPPAGQPVRVWAWLDAHSEELAQRQADALGAELATPSPLVLRVREVAADCGCGDDGPCGQRELAGALEAGLPLCAHPYGALAARLGRPEREVRARLRRWMDQGWLSGIGLLPHFARDHQPTQGLLLKQLPPHEPPWPAGLQRVSWTPRPDWPFVLELRWHGTAERADLLRGLLAAGLNAARVLPWRGVLQPLRRQAGLFSAVGLDA